VAALRRPAHDARIPPAPEEREMHRRRAAIGAARTFVTACLAVSAALVLVALGPARAQASPCAAHATMAADAATPPA
jgi:hypothetical protein